jgi:hypothetical protein
MIVKNYGCAREEARLDILSKISPARDEGSTEATDNMFFVVKINEQFFVVAMHAEFLTRQAQSAALKEQTIRR